MKNWKLSADIPFWAVITLGLLAFVVISIFYLVVSFIYTWIKSDYKTAKAEFEENTTKVLMAFFAPFIVVVNFFKAFFEALDELFIERPWKNLAEFFAWCAGADLEAFRLVDSTARKEKTAIGATMVIIIAITSALAGNSWGNIFHSLPIGCAIGLVWFIMILSLDRTVLKWMDKNSGWKVVAARLVMVVAVGYLNTLFVSIEIYHDEIMAQIQEDKQNEINGISDSVSVVNKKYQTERDQLQVTVDDAHKAYLGWAAEEQGKIDAQRTLWTEHNNQFIGEVAGNIGSGKRGWGDAAKAAYAIAQTDSITLAAMIAKFDADKETSPAYIAYTDAQKVQAKRDAELVTEINKNNDYLNQRTDGVHARKQDGFGHRVDAMWKQAGKRPFTFFMTFMFFLSLESMPVLLKAMSNKGNYETEIRLRTEEFATEKQHQRSVAMLTKQYGYSKTIDDITINHLRESANRLGVMNGLRQTAHDQRIQGLDALNKQLAEIEARLSSLPEEQREEIKQTFYKKVFAEFAQQLN
jgi:hypothetical protein